MQMREDLVFFERITLDFVGDLKEPSRHPHKTRDEESLLCKEE